MMNIRDYFSINKTKTSNKIKSGVGASSNPLRLNKKLRASRPLRQTERLLLIFPFLKAFSDSFRGLFSLSYRRRKSINGWTNKKEEEAFFLSFFYPVALLACIRQLLNLQSKKPPFLLIKRMK